MAWSGDGRRILFSSASGNFWEVSLAKPGNAQKLPFGYDAQDIALSPTAHRLVYVQGVTNTNIWRLNLQASPPKADKLIVSSRQQISPSISPDGSKIAFESDRTGFNEIRVCDADGSNPIQLSPARAFAHENTLYIPVTARDTIFADEPFPGRRIHQRHVDFVSMVFAEVFK
jgi:Tol biopolymer transport system component